NGEYAKFCPNITVKKAPPPVSKEWEGKPDKLQYFSPNPGAGTLRLNHPHQDLVRSIEVCPASPPTP
ncbi:MAG: DUF3470 domain-containing protein, partial [Xanthobacteraceae bacterium]